MFATLLGPLPRPPLPADAAPEALLDASLALQVEHGLEPLTDAGWALAGDGAGPSSSVAGVGAEAVVGAVAAWRSTAARTDRLVKAVIRGPFSAGSDGVRERRAVLDLAEAGCTWIEIHEPAAVSVGADPALRARFSDLHRALTADLDGIHLSLAITGGTADAAGIGTILAGVYASLALDLIAGPDNWRLAAAAPGDRGIIAGVVAPRAGSDDGPEIMLWAAGYAASTGGRGPARVGLATAGSFAGLPWEVAAEKVRRLGAAARLATAPPEERLAAIDPRAVDIRSAGLGRYMPGRPRRARRPGGSDRGVEG
jgi:hypothetical protein